MNQKFKNWLENQLYLEIWILPRNKNRENIWMIYNKPIHKHIITSGVKWKWENIIERCRRWNILRRKLEKEWTKTLNNGYKTKSK
jgi:hypothetical protein